MPTVLSLIIATSAGSVSEEPSPAGRHRRSSYAPHTSFTSWEVVYLEGETWG